MQWFEEVQWAIQRENGRATNAEIYRFALACCVYKIWLERNGRVFQQRKVEAYVLVKQIVQEAMRDETMRHIWGCPDDAREL
ncbi:hypothetical protein CQW23_14605 [Capsicum baccatum]|uniref:Uncharacterized protein n=1 Tax=Capsicum baccatum TaxID=33114 RepID=A0A2G2WJM2_CAPBA|nr:hypothetical protein CQW23_14605 [Capsicum baccatum]